MRLGVRRQAVHPMPHSQSVGWVPLRRQPAHFGPVAICQKHPRLTLGREIAQAPVRQANRLTVTTNIEFAVRCTVDFDRRGTLIAHLIPPLDFGAAALSANNQQRVNPEPPL